MIGQSDEMTDLKCSRCGTTVVSVPMILRADGTITVMLALDLCRVSIKHGFECPGRNG